jgi:hypothetical protein
MYCDYRWDIESEYATKVDMDLGLQLNGRFINWKTFLLTGRTISNYK